MKQAPAPGSAARSADEGVIRAAGAVPWRQRGQLEVALVHRPKYDDWSWPKGKLEPGETWVAASAREVLEETGMRVRLGLPLPEAAYAVGSETGTRQKVVRYWAAEVLDSSGRGDGEVDQTAWLGLDAAARRLDYQRDHEQLQALAAADADGRLRTWPVALVRHARALGRRHWKRPDPSRPLNDAGRARAQALVPLLSAYGVRELVSSPAVRCTGTLQPYANASATSVRRRQALSEEGFDRDPLAAAAVLESVLASGVPAALCSHGPVLPVLLGRLVDRCADATLADGLRASGRAGMGKGELLVAHVAGSGPQAAVVAVERYPGS